MNKTHSQQEITETGEFRHSLDNGKDLSRGGDRGKTQVNRITRQGKGGAKTKTQTRAPDAN